MVDPIQLRILQHLQVSLRTIRVADGYGWTVKPERVFLDPINMLTAAGDCTDNPIMAVEPTANGVRAFEPAEQLRDEFEVTVMARVDTKGSDPDRRYVAALRLEADIERALVRLPSQVGADGYAGTADITRGGLVSDTRLRKASIFFDGGATGQIVIITIPVLMPIHRTYGVPR
jgi:hypothetical protein